jgi:ABC-type Zn2+ transport system substrate-binding protein/surface adhesin
MFLFKILSFFFLTKLIICYKLSNHNVIYNIKNKFKMNYDYFIDKNLYIYFNDKNVLYINLHHDERYFLIKNKDNKNNNNDKNKDKNKDDDDDNNTDQDNDKDKEFIMNYLEGKINSYTIYKNNIFYNTDIENKYKNIIENELNKNSKKWININKIIFKEERYINRN